MSRNRSIFFAAALLFAAGAQAAAGTWSTNGPYGGTTWKVVTDESGPSTLWAIGDGGVFRSTSGGSAWSRIETGLPGALTAVGFEAATSAPVLYLADAYRVYRSADGGDVWTPTSLSLAAGSNIDSLALRRGTTDTIAVLATGALYLSSNGGTTYASAAGLDPEAIYGGVRYASDGTLYLSVLFDPNDAHDGAQLITSTTGGASWSAATLPATMSVGITLLTIAPSAPSRLYASDGFSIATSADGGATWTDLEPPANCGLVRSLSVRITYPLGVYAGCENLGLAYANDVTLPPPAAWTIAGAAAGLTYNGTGDAAQIASLAFPPGFPGSNPTAYAGTVHGGVFRTDDGGATWTAINNGLQSVRVRALAAHPHDASVVLAGQADTVSTAPVLFRSLDSAASWSYSHASLNAEQVRALAIDPTTVDTTPANNEPFTVYAVGRSDRIPDIVNKDGGIYKSTDGGATWATIDNGIATVNGRRDLGTVRGVYLDPRSCASPPPSGPCAIGSGPLQKVVIVGSGVVNQTAAGLPYLSARIYRSANAGTTWTASDNGLPLPEPAPGVLGPAYRTGGVAAIVGEPNGTTLYAGTFLAGYSQAWPTPTITNGVFKSTDGGATWAHSSNGLPRIAGGSTSHLDVLALAIDPFHPQTLYAATVDLAQLPLAGAIYKTTDGGANWTVRTTGIAGQDVRALYVDANDTTGNTVYAATGGGSTDPGGVYRTTDGGLTWNSHSLGLATASATALALPPRAPGAPARVLAGTEGGVWDYTEAPDGDDDGAPNDIEALVGDGNGDTIADATQRNVASIVAPTRSAHGGSVTITTAIVGGCTQINNNVRLDGAQFPPDPAGGAASHDPWGLVRIELPACANAVVDVKFHGANFAGSDWFWRNYGPGTPGEVGTFGWYVFSGATKVGTNTWRLAIDATRQGNYRADANNILFIGGPAQLPGLIFANGFE